MDVLTNMVKANQKPTNTETFTQAISSISKAQTSEILKIVNKKLNNICGTRKRRQNARSNKRKDQQHRTEECMKEWQNVLKDKIDNFGIKKFHYKQRTSLYQIDKDIETETENELDFNADAESEQEEFGDEYTQFINKKWTNLKPTCINPMKNYSTVKDFLNEIEVGYYEKSKRFWNAQPSNFNGVLETFAKLSDSDIQSGKQILEKHIKNKSEELSVFEAGAGIGRVTKGVLNQYFKHVEILDINEKYIKKAVKTAIVQKAHTGNLNSHQMMSYYDCFWYQWMLMYMKDRDIINTLRSHATYLNDDGFMVVRENSVEQPAFADRKKRSINRSKEYMEILFKESGLTVEDYKLHNNTSEACSYSTWVLKPKVSVKLEKVVTEQSRQQTVQHVGDNHSPSQLQNLHSQSQPPINLQNQQPIKLQTKVATVSGTQVQGPAQPQQQIPDQENFFTDLIMGKSNKKEATRKFLNQDYKMFEDFDPIQIHSLMQGLFTKPEHKQNMVEFIKHATLHVRNAIPQRQAAFHLIVAFSHLVTVRGIESDLAKQFIDGWKTVNQVVKNIMSHSLGLIFTQSTVIELFLSHLQFEFTPQTLMTAQVYDKIIDQQIPVEAVRLVACVGDSLEINLMQLDQNLRQLCVDKKNPNNCCATQCVKFMKNYFDTYIEKKKTLTFRDFDHIWDCLHSVSSNRWLEVLNADDVSDKMKSVIKSCEAEKIKEDLLMQQEKLMTTRSENIIRELQVYANDCPKETISVIQQSINELKLQRRTEQLVVIKAIFSMLPTHKRIIGQLPCAFGKTMILLLLAYSLFKKQDKSTFLVVPTTVLKKQLLINTRKKVLKLEEFKKSKAKGLYILTLDELLKEVKNSEMKDVNLLVDEFHGLLKKLEIEEYIRTADCFISFTATMGYTNSSDFQKVFNNPHQFFEEDEEDNVIEQMKIDFVLKLQSKKTPQILVAEHINKLLNGPEPDWGQYYIVFVKSDQEKDNYLSSFKRYCKSIKVSQIHKFNDKTKDDVDRAFACLGQLDKQQQSDYNPQNDTGYIRVLLATKENAEGVNYFQRCYVIMTYTPRSLTELIQIMGRSNRKCFTGDQNGAIIVDPKDPCKDFTTLVQNLKSKQIDGESSEEIEQNKGDN